MKITLSKSQKKELQMKESEIQHPKLLRRIHVIQMKDVWMNNKEIQKTKWLSHGTVSTRIKWYSEGWIEKLLQRNCNGRPAKLWEEELKQLSKRWEDWFNNAQEAQEYINSEFGTSYKVRQVQNILKKHYILTKRLARHQESVQL